MFKLFVIWIFSISSLVSLIFTGWRFVQRPELPNDSNDGLWGNTQIRPWVEVLLLPPQESVSQEGTALAVLRRFEFDPDIRMMSVLVEEISIGDSNSSKGRIWILTKGAPERYPRLSVFSGW